MDVPPYGDIDLSGYATTAAVNTALGSYVLSSALATALAGLVILAPGASTRNVLQASGDFTPLVIRSAVAGQTEDLLSIYSVSAGVDPDVRVTNDGDFFAQQLYSQSLVSDPSRDYTLAIGGGGIIIESRIDEIYFNDFRTGDITLSDAAYSSLPVGATSLLGGIAEAYTLAADAYALADGAVTTGELTTALASYSTTTAINTALGLKLNASAVSAFGLTLIDDADAATARATLGFTDANLSTSDVTTNDVSTAKHGFTPKAPNDATKFLNGLGAWSVPAGGTNVSGWELITDYTVSGGPVASITVSGLDGDVDEWYRFELFIVNAVTSSAICMRPNGDATSGNYRYQYALASDSSVAAGRGDFSSLILANTNTIGDVALVQGLIHAKSGQVRLCDASTTANVNGTTQDSYIWKQQWKDTVSNIANLYFFSTAAGSPLNDGSYLRVWKAV